MAWTSKDGFATPGLVILISLPIAGFGLFLLVMVAHRFYFWNQIQDWVKTPCTIVSAEFKIVSPGDEKGCLAVAHYKYQWADEWYECDRVAIHTVGDGIGDFQEQTAMELIRFQNSQEEFRCFVNPDKPTEAIIYRDVRMGAQAYKGILGLVAGYIGFSLLFQGVGRQKRVKRK